MRNLMSSLSTGQALLVGLALIGCTTALAITGHISGDAALTTFGLVGGGALGVTGAHVGGAVANNAAANATTTTTAPTSSAATTTPTTATGPTVAA